MAKMSRPTLGGAKTSRRSSTREKTRQTTRPAGRRRQEAPSGKTSPKRAFKELAAIASKAQKELNRADFVKWTDLEEGNSVIFSLRGEEGEEANGRFTYPKYFTPDYVLYDIDLNVIKRGRENDLEEEDQGYSMPTTARVMDEIAGAFDEGMTCCLMTAHEYIQDWKNKKTGETISFHKVHVEFGDDKSSMADFLMSAD